jgi:hypothetical protein
MNPETRIALLSGGRNRYQFHKMPPPLPFHPSTPRRDKARSLAVFAAMQQPRATFGLLEDTITYRYDIDATRYNITRHEEDDSGPDAFESVPLFVLENALTF